MKFTYLLPSQSFDLLNLQIRTRATPCRHCQRRGQLKSHGFLRGYAESGHGQATRGIRFFCSNRYSNAGCGRTFSVHWDSVIPHCSLRSSPLHAFVQALSKSPSVLTAWGKSKFSLSISSAYRWARRWSLSTTHIRSLLGLLCAPPTETGPNTPAEQTLRQLAQAFPDSDCHLAAFQSVLQRKIVL